MSDDAVRARERGESVGSRGWVAVLTMVGLALAAATFAWWWNYERGHRALAFYGADAAGLIRTAPTVELFVSAPLEERSAGGEESHDAGATRQLDISRAPGLIHARTSLLDDASYDWKAAPKSSTSGERASVRFVGKNDQVMLRFDFDSRSVTVIPDGNRATLVEKTAEGWRAFVTRNARTRE